MTEENLLVELTPELVERVVATALRPLPPPDQMIPRLTQERMLLERERLEAERLGLQVAQRQQQQAAAQASAAQASAAATPAAQPPTPAAQPTTPAAKPAAPARTPSQPRVPVGAPTPWGLLAAAAGVAFGLTVMIGWALRGKPPAPKTTKTAAAKTATKTADGPRSPATLQRLFSELKQDLDMLKLDDPAALKRELARLREQLALLKRSPFGKARPDALAALGARLDAATDLASAPDPLPKVTAAPQPSPTPSPGVEPTASPSPSPAATPTARPSPSPTPTPELSPEKRRFKAKALLVFALRAYDGKKPAELERVVGRLKALGGELEQLRVAEGLLAFLRGRYDDAHQKLAGTSERDERVVLARVQSAQFTARYPAARKELDGLSPTRRRVWQRLVDGPFRAEYPNAADAVETTTPDKAFRVITDVGLAPNHLSKLEAKLAQTPPKMRYAVVSTARREHRVLAAVVKLLEATTAELREALPLAGTPRAVASVYLFRDAAELSAFTAGLGKLEGERGGYLPAVQAICVADAPGGGKKGLAPTVQQALRHAAGHHWVQLQAAGAPPWLGEGIAAHVDGRGDRRAVIQGGLKGSISPAPLGLAELLQADAAAFDVQRPMNGAQAWSLVRYLRAEKARQTLLADYVAALRGGQDAKQAYAVFEKADVKALEAGWRAFVGKLR